MELAADDFPSNTPEAEVKAKLAKDYLESAFIQHAEDPLLKDYNRLALKAAIEHAYREGADAIAISDAETAMMSEQHDQHATRSPIANRVTKESVEAAYRADGYDGIYWEGNVLYNDTGTRLGTFSDGSFQFGFPDYYNTPEEYPNIHKLGLDKTPRIEQEPGMRFNYDPNPTSAGRSGKPGALHELASELTKYPGERVSFGEHQNAFPDMREVAGNQDTGPLIGLPALRPGVYADFNAALAAAGVLQGKNSRHAGGAVYGDLPFGVHVIGEGNRYQLGIFPDDFRVHRQAAEAAGFRRDRLPRENLILRNPDGTPKTDITAQLYPIDKVAAKLDISPFAISGKGPKGMELYSFPGPQIS